MTETVPDVDPDTPAAHCRVVAVTNQKGGVGKTTAAVTLAYGLAQAGKRTLLIDLAPQAHATMRRCQLLRDDTICRQRGERWEGRTVLGP